MTPERWEKVREVLGQVLELAPEKRPQYLDDARANDMSLRSEVESLLSSDGSARSSFLQSPPVSPAALTKGTRLGDYEIVSLLGSGGMGEVYRARDTKLKREVAIKVLPPYWSRDLGRLQRFELEARAAAALNPPNITSIFHVGQHDGSPYIVTELLHGETLHEQFRKGPLRPRPTTKPHPANRTRDGPSISTVVRSRTVCLRYGQTLLQRALQVAESAS